MKAIFRLAPLILAEMLRNEYRKNPAPVQMIFDKLAKNTDRLPIKLSLWDFAAQRFYYNTHPTFMSPDAVYIIVFDLFKFKQESLRANNRVQSY